MIRFRIDPSVFVLRSKIWPQQKDDSSKSSCVTGIVGRCSSLCPRLLCSVNNDVQVDQATSSAQEQGENLQKYAVVVDDLALKVSSLRPQDTFSSHAVHASLS